MKKSYLVEFEWKIERTDKCGFRTGTSRFIATCNNKIEAINHAIEFSQNIPSWEFERNEIDLKRYVDDCRGMYKTQLTRIIQVKVNA